MKNAPFQILLVDDDADDILLTSRMLEAGRVDVRVRTAANGAEALELLRRGGSGPRPELILLDINMPVMNGVQFLREFRADALFRSIAVVVLTTSAAALQLDADRSLGADAYVDKPFGMDQAGPLNALVEDYSRRRAASVVSPIERGRQK
jgi:CheY-like chemotaxis protein